MSYAHDRLADALSTATSHQDEATRKSALRRVEKWRAHIHAVTSRAVTVGSRTPARIFPEWVTLEVLRGGFASGTATAESPLTRADTDLAAELDVPAGRSAIFEALLSQAGLPRLEAMLDDGDYTLACAEESVVLVAAWLLRNGHDDDARRLVSEVGPWSDILRLWPARALVPVDDALVHRHTVTEALSALRGRTVPLAVRAQRESLTVWAPLADRLLGLWWQTVVDGAVDAHRPEGWDADCASALVSYNTVRTRHTLCTQHSDPKANLGVLVEATRAGVTGELDRVLRVRLQRAVDAMVRRRGAPGSSELVEARSSQLTAITATHATLASVVAERLDPLPGEGGIVDTAEALAPVRASEASEEAPAGTALPDSVRRDVLRSRAATIDELVADRVLTSAELLAEVAPQLVARAWSDGYADPALRTLMGRVYSAFRARRSVLLVGMAAQVRIDELPWVRAVRDHDGAGEAEAAREALLELSRAYLDHFPGQILPNSLVVELTALARRAGVDATFVPELAADIFQDDFAPRFPAAAQTAADALRGTVYDTYYGLSSAAQTLAARMVKATRRRARRLRRPPESEPQRSPAQAAFTEVCRDRARSTHPRHDARSAPGGWLVANGAVIEQAQVLTTHGLVTLRGLGATPTRGWEMAAGTAFTVVRDALARAYDSWSFDDEDSPATSLREVTKAAYAWRQTIFFVSQVDEKAARRILEKLRDRAAAAGPHGRAAWSSTETSRVLLRLVGDLDAALDGRAPAQPFLGWTVGPHPMLGMS